MAGLEMPTTATDLMVHVCVWGLIKDQRVGEVDFTQAYVGYGINEVGIKVMKNCRIPDIFSCRL